MIYDLFESYESWIESESNGFCLIDESNRINLLKSHSNDDLNRTILFKIFWVVSWINLFFLKAILNRFTKIWIIYMSGQLPIRNDAEKKGSFYPTFLYL